MKNEKKTYQITTRLYMKDYNQDKFWITSDYVPDVDVDGCASLKEAIEKYREYLDQYGVEISDHAARNKDQLFDRAGRQVGYAFTGKTLIADRGADYCGYQYIDVYARINIVSYEDAFCD